MTNVIAKAEIEWVPENEGGRASPPPGPRYITVARFEDEKEKYPEEAWSLVVDFNPPQDELGPFNAHVRFLADEAPSHLLRPGSSFELYEGRKLVARGVVASP